LGTGRADHGGCFECEAWPEALHAARAAYVLEGPGADLVHGLKYEGWRHAAHEMGEAMVRVLRDWLPADDSVVVPVPTTPKRLRSRGYNQAELLARAVAEGVGLPVHDVLERPVSRGSQTGLGSRERRANVGGAFSVRNEGSAALAGARVLLVDDVLTTGATAGEVASVLGAAGALRVRLVTFARTLPNTSATRPGRAA
jgi:ComF family protein